MISRRIHQLQHLMSRFILPYLCSRSHNGIDCREISCNGAVQREQKQLSIKQSIDQPDSETAPTQFFPVGHTILFKILVSQYLCDNRSDKKQYGENY